MKAETKHSYVSGHCEIDRHAACRGSYAGTECMCPCGHGEPVQVQLDFVPETLPSPARLMDPAPLLQAVWLGTEVLAVSS